jgi:hypothetical protein
MTTIYLASLVASRRVKEGDVFSVTWEEREFKTMMFVSGTVSKVLIIADRMIPLIDEEGTG